MGPIAFELNTGQKMLYACTIFVFMEIAATNAAPLDSNYRFVVFWLRFGHINDADVPFGEELCCFHV